MKKLQVGSDGDVMVQDGIGNKGDNNLQFTESEMKSIKYLNLIMERINKLAQRIVKGNFHDNVTVHWVKFILNKNILKRKRKNQLYQL